MNTKAALEVKNLARRNRLPVVLEQTPKVHGVSAEENTSGKVEHPHVFPPVPRVMYVSEMFPQSSGLRIAGHFTCTESHRSCKSRVHFDPAELNNTVSRGNNGIRYTKNEPTRQKPERTIVFVLGEGKQYALNETPTL